MNRRVLYIVVGTVLCGGIAWAIFSATEQEPMAVPVLKEDGSLGATMARRSTLLATLVKEGYQTNTLLTYWSPGEEQVHPVKIGFAQPEDAVSWECPPGTNIRASRVFSNWDGGPNPATAPPSREMWGWGPYVGRTGPDGESGDEGARLMAGDDPEMVFPDVVNGPGNKFFGWAGLAFASFVNKGDAYILGPGRYYASSEVAGPGSYNYVRCQIPPTPICGDHFIDPPETCDDGNTVTGDGCGPTCLLEVCGNGFLDPGEQCDDGNANNTDACVGTCRNAICGDGFVRAGVEECDDGNTMKGDGCSDSCRFTAQCNDGVDNVDPEDALIDRADPGCHIDGNATHDASYEPTDDNEVNGASCGNGVLEGGEECDDGNTAAGDGCSSTCRITTECNDGVDNMDPEDALFDCSDPGCHTDGNAANTGSCNPADVSELNSPSCGDGVVNGGDACDDGNTSNTDSCRNGCIINVCGDGFVNIGVEQCDDAKTCMGTDADGFPIGDGRWCETNTDCVSQPGTTCALHALDGCDDEDRDGNGRGDLCVIESLHVCELQPDTNPPTPERSACTLGVPAPGARVSSSSPGSGPTP